MLSCKETKSRGLQNSKAQERAEAISDGLQAKKLRDRECENYSCGKHKQNKIRKPAYAMKHIRRKKTQASRIQNITKDPKFPFKKPKKIKR